MKILFATSEAYPLIKTGGLGDVAESLPRALSAHGLDARIVLPAYRRVLEQLTEPRILGWLDIATAAGPQVVRVLEASHPAFSASLFLIDAPALFDRDGGPYQHPDGYDWPDNAERFTVFSRAVAQLADDRLGIGWRADLVHANDWQTGLVPAYLSQLERPPRSVFTIHNIAYDCQFDMATFSHLQMPHSWWSMHLGEFYGRFSMLKAGLVFSDVVTTVSPTYAEEICTPAYGYGYAAVLQTNCDKLHGILNGIDAETWNPRTDPLLVAHYQRKSPIRPAKKKNRKALLQTMGAGKTAIDASVPLLGFIGRLVDQKGVDLLADTIPVVFENHDVQFVIIGTGHTHLEQRLSLLAQHYPDRLFLHLGYDEPLAHLLEAGSDMFVMPSRYEPCGLNQMYSMHYGTPPIVHTTGGLADTVVDASAENLRNGSATGFVFEYPEVQDLSTAISRALALHADPKAWMALMKTGMKQDFSWERSASEYIRLYRAPDSAADGNAADGNNA